MLFELWWFELWRSHCIWYNVYRKIMHTNPQNGQKLLYNFLWLQMMHGKLIHSNNWDFFIILKLGYPNPDEVPSAMKFRCFKIFKLPDFSGNIVQNFWCLNHTRFISVTFWTELRIIFDLMFLHLQLQNNR